MLIRVITANVGRGSHNKKPSLAILQCDRCGKQFEGRYTAAGGRRDRVDHYCSRSCTNKGRKHDFVRDSRPCKHCHELFTPTSPNNKLCLRCVPDADAYGRLKDYGISQVEYDALRVFQNNACAICKRNNVKLCIDHCHKTGIVRGLLCSSCNNGLGYYEKPLWPEAAQHYLSLVNRSPNLKGLGQLSFLHLLRKT
jgi:hypothetical protein